MAMTRAGLFRLASAGVLLATLAACAGSPSREPPGPTALRAANGQTPSANDRRFSIEWSAGQTTEAEVEAVRTRAEAAYARMRELLGDARVVRADKRPFVIRLAGDAAPGQYPLVSPDTGEIILYRFPGKGGAYEASLAHELVHALRFALWTNPAKQTDPFLFWDEGFAEILATEAGFPSAGFPTFGHSVALTAGACTETHEDPRVTDLVRRHRALNFRCMAQSYGLRLSFMTFVRERFGLAKMVALSYVDEPLTESVIERGLGGKLEDLEAAWKVWLRERLDAEGHAAARIEEYRTQSPIRFFPKCTKEVLEGR